LLQIFLNNPCQNRPLSDRLSINTEKPGSARKYLSVIVLLSTITVVFIVLPARVFLLYLRGSSWVFGSVVMALRDLEGYARITGQESWIYIERVGRNYHKIVPDGHDVKSRGDPRIPEI
jgi:hypothetical protein